METTDGRTLTRFVEQSLGNVHRPLSDKQLEDKLRDQSVPLLGEAQVEKLIDLCWKIDQLDDVSELIQATVRS
jgi:2-methylcitrate dehydratase PrpD